MSRHSQHGRHFQNGTHFQASLFVVRMHGTIYSDSQRYVISFFYLLNNIKERPFQLIANLAGSMCKMSAFIKDGHQYYFKLQ